MLKSLTSSMQFATLLVMLIIFWWLGDPQAGLAWHGGDWATVLVALLLTMLALHLIVTPAAHQPEGLGACKRGMGLEN